jgi:uncharacterized protein
VDEGQRVSRLTSTPPAEDSGDEVVREYEERYAAPRPKIKAALPRSYSTMRVTDDEKLWSAVAHGSVWITLLAGIFTVGAGVPVSIFIPLVIYFLFRRKSDYVAFHALQAFVIQLVGTVGALALLILGGMVWLVGMFIAVLSIAVVVGAVLVPLWSLVGLALVGLVAALPVAMIIYGTIATIETYNGRDYRYPFIARWVDRQLAGNFLTAG